MQSNLFKQATDPKQYDQEALYWEEMGATNSPTRQFFKEFLFADSNKFRDANILDIGSGTSWLLEEMRNRGARTVLGIEPSEHNVMVAKRIYPDVTTMLSSLDNFESNTEYDHITSVMVMVHISDVDHAMSKIAELLKPLGELHMFVPPYEYTKTPRFDYKIKTEDINEDEYVAAVKRPNGVITDIIRKTSVYQEAGNKAGLSLVEAIDMKPTKNLLEREPKYEQFKDAAIAEYLLFRKG